MPMRNESSENSKADCIIQGRLQVRLPRRLHSKSEGTGEISMINPRKSKRLIYRCFLRYHVLRKDKGCHSERKTAPGYRKLMTLHSRFISNSTLLPRNEFSAFSAGVMKHKSRHRKFAGGLTPRIDRTTLSSEISAASLYKL